MADGYQHRPQGEAGMRKLITDLQRQMAESRGAAPLTSTRITDQQGRLVAIFGIGQTTRVAEDLSEFQDTIYGAQFYNPTSGDLLFAAASYESDGSSYVQAGDANEIDALAIWRVFAVSAAMGAGEINLNAFTANGTGIVRLSAEDRISLSSSAQDVRMAHTTTGSAANMFIDSVTARVFRSTSSRRYKEDVGDAQIDPADVLKINARTWVDKGAIDRAEPGHIRRHVGLIAEELDELPSMRQFVNYDENGDPDSIEESRLAVAVLELAKAQQAQIDALAKRLDALEG